MTAVVPVFNPRAEPRRAVKRGYPRDAGTVRLCRTLGAVERLLYQRLVDAVVLDVKTAPTAALALPTRFPRIPMFVLSALRADDGPLLAACDVFVRPTLADGDSVSVREALALGRAVVATSVGHRPEGVLLVPPGDAAALSAAMIEAVEGSERRPAEVPADSLQRILSLYGVTACAVSAAS